MDPRELPHTDKIAIEYGDEIPDGFEVDKEELIRKNIYLPLRKIIAEMGWSFDEVRGGSKTSTMDLGGDMSEVSEITSPESSNEGIFE